MYPKAVAIGAKAKAYALGVMSFGTIID